MAGEDKVGTAVSPEKQDIPPCHPSLGRMGVVLPSPRAAILSTPAALELVKTSSSATPSELLAAACQNESKRGGEVIKISFINTIPHRPGEAEVLSAHVITTALLFPNLEEMLPKSAAAPSPAPLATSSYF